MSRALLSLIRVGLVASLGSGIAHDVPCSQNSAAGPAKSAEAPRKPAVAFERGINRFAHVFNFVFNSAFHLAELGVCMHWGVWAQWLVADNGEIRWGVCFQGDACGFSG
jgi:hypothetical protein